MWLFIAFLTIPILEIALFIQVGGFLGLWPTLAIVVATAFAGTYLVRNQGLLAMSEVKSSMSQASNPAEPLAHGAMILLAGILLLTPGFFTDGVGFALLIPAVRRAVMAYFKGRMNFVAMDMSGQQAQQQPSSGTVVEGEFEEITPKDRKSSGPSGWTNH